MLTESELKTHFRHFAEDLGPRPLASCEINHERGMLEVVIEEGAARLAVDLPLSQFTEANRKHHYSVFESIAHDWHRQVAICSRR